MMLYINFAETRGKSGHFVNGDQSRFKNLDVSLTQVPIVFFASELLMTMWNAYLSNRVSPLYMVLWHLVNSQLQSMVIFTLNSNIFTVRKIH